MAMVFEDSDIELDEEALEVTTEHATFGLLPSTDSESECSICLSTPEQPYETTCGHIFCRSCVVAWYEAVLEPSSDTPIEVPCPNCRVSIGRGKLVQPDHQEIDQMANSYQAFHLGTGLLTNTFYVGRYYECLDIEGIPDRWWTKLELDCQNSRWIREVQTAHAFVRHEQPAFSANTEAELYGRDAAEHAIIAGNIMMYTHKLATANSGLRHEWAYIVTILAEMLSGTSWRFLCESANELQDSISTALVTGIDIPGTNRFYPFGSLNQSPFFNPELSCHYSGMLDTLCTYIVYRAALNDRTQTVDWPQTPVSLDDDYLVAVAPDSPVIALIDDS